MSTVSDSEKLAKYYQAELSYLRNSGMEFAHRYPNIAEKLDISEAESADPQVERMLESFAFMTGKLQKQIDDQFSDIANHLLSIIYEQLAAPIPSMTMLHFDADMALTKQAQGAIIKRHTEVYATADNTDVTCTFRTCHDVVFWPIELQNVSVIVRDDIDVKNIELTSSFYLRLQFNGHSPDNNKRPKNIRLYINGNHKFKSELFAALFLSQNNIIVKQGGNSTCGDKISGVGVTHDEATLPCNSANFAGFRLLQEYFAFPDKFFGFSIHLPDSINISETFEVFIPMAYHCKLPATSNVLLMNAVPAINLFNKISDPLRLTYKDVCYRLLADAYRNNSTEIMSVKKVMQVDTNTNREQEVFPFFSSSRNTAFKNDGIMWYTKRKKSYLRGDDFDIYFVDQNLTPESPVDKIFYAHTVCTNRHLAELMPAFTQFNIEATIPVKQIYCLQKPTKQRDAISDGESVWALMSLLSSSFLDDYEKKTKELLRLFSSCYAKSAIDEIDSISSIGVKQIAKFNHGQAWKGFMRGSSITINFESNAPHSVIALSYVLSHIFSVYTSINTFTELKVKTDFGEKTWEMQIGLHNYL